MATTFCHQTIELLALIRTENGADLADSSLNGGSELWVGLLTDGLNLVLGGSHDRTDLITLGDVQVEPVPQGPDNFVSGKGRFAVGNPLEAFLGQPQRHQSAGSHPK